MTRTNKLHKKLRKGPNTARKTSAQFRKRVFVKSSTRARKTSSVVSFKPSVFNTESESGSYSSEYSTSSSSSSSESNSSVSGSSSSFSEHYSDTTLSEDNETDCVPESVLELVDKKDEGWVSDVDMEDRFRAKALQELLDFGYKKTKKAIIKKSGHWRSNIFISNAGRSRLERKSVGLRKWIYRVRAGSKVPEQKKKFSEKDIQKHCCQFLKLNASQRMGFRFYHRSVAKVDLGISLSHFHWRCKVYIQGVRLNRQPNTLTPSGKLKRLRWCLKHKDVNWKEDIVHEDETNFYWITPQAQYKQYCWRGSNAAPVETNSDKRKSSKVMTSVMFDYNTLAVCVILNLDERPWVTDPTKNTFSKINVSQPRFVALMGEKLREFVGERHLLYDNCTPHPKTIEGVKLLGFPPNSCDLAAHEQIICRLKDHYYPILQKIKEGSIDEATQEIKDRWLQRGFGWTQLVKQCVAIELAEAAFRREDMQFLKNCVDSMPYNMKLVAEDQGAYLEKRSRKKRIKLLRLQDAVPDFEDLNLNEEAPGFSNYESEPVVKSEPVQLPEHPSLAGFFCGKDNPFDPQEPPCSPSCPTCQTHIL